MKRYLDTKTKRYAISRDDGRIDLDVVREAVRQIHEATDLTEDERDLWLGKARALIVEHGARVGPLYEGARLLEAAARFRERQISLTDRVEAVQAAVSARYRHATPLEDSAYGWAEVIYEDSVIVCERGKDGKKRYWSLSYKFEAATGTVTLGEPVEYEIYYGPKAESLETVLGDGQLRHAAHVLHNREAEAGGVWDILIIQAGMSLNRNHYAVEALTAAAPLYEGATSYVNHKTEDEAGIFGRGVEEAAGFLRDVRPAYVTESEGEPRA